MPKNGTLTVSGESVGLTRVPSNRNRTLLGALPWRSQKASISFFSCVVFLILKNTSLFPSVTLMLRCSDGSVSGLAGAQSVGSDIACARGGRWIWLCERAVQREAFELMRERRERTGGGSLVVD